MKLLGTLKRLLGLDRAIFYTVLARIVSILGSTGTVLLIIHFLSPVEQGYYYALWSLVSLQVIFELGFSFVIQQHAAHESAHLLLEADGRVSGSEAAHDRLASILQLMVRWYGRAGAFMVSLLVPGGWLFFFHRQGQTDHVAWQGPWVLAAIACAGTFLLAPFYSFIDGCGKVREVAAMRLREGIAALVMAWAAMIAHHGLFAPAMVLVGQTAVGCHFVWQWRRPLRALYGRQSIGHRVSWKSEILPFQWRIAISWFCSYFTAQAFIPLLFTLRGPVDAGQMGMSLSITSFMTFLLLPWVSTKATPFGRMIAQNDFASLNNIFFSAFRMSMILLALVALLALAGIEVVKHVVPVLAARLVRPPIFAILLLTMMSNYTVQSLAIYLRSFKREPFLGLYLTTSVLSIITVSLTAKHWGNMGAAVSYLFCTGIVGLMLAVVIFARYRRRITTLASVGLREESVQ